jgi:hypothetical protein
MNTHAARGNKMNNRPSGKKIERTLALVFGRKKTTKENAVRELSQRFSEYHQQNDDEDHLFLLLLLLLLIIIISVIVQNDDVCSTPKKTTERNDESAFFFSFQTTRPKNDDDDVNFSERRTTQKEENYQRSNDDIDIRLIRKRRGRRKRRRIESTKIIAFCFGRRNGVMCRWRERSASQPIGSVRDDNDIAARLGVGGIERGRFRSRNRKDNRQYTRSVICGV